MNILLLGYGKMGQLIEELALKKGHTIICKINSKNGQELHLIDTSIIDVAVEFSKPETVLENVKWCIDNQIPVVIGTTGWQENKPELDDYCNNKKGTYFFASNFSIGVNLFFKLNEQLAKKLNPFNEYNPSITEIHHTDKLDTPSGTAITLADGIITNLDRKDKWTNTKSSEPGTIEIKSERIDPTPGTHTITYESSIDKIEIKHTAHSRLGFATGALLVAEWIIDKKGVLSMDDFLSL
jgi:4-hydroxy-tetrahydrodipicolinate reductase